MRTSYRVAIAACFTGVLLLAIYWPGLHGSFFFDDGPSILQAKGVRLETLSFESLRQVFASGHSGPSGRPIAQLSFALNYYFSGFSPFLFKITNLAIHAANACLVFFLAFRLLAGTEQPAKQHIALIAAGVLATAWMLHPIQLLPVLHVVQRMTSLSTLFLLAALLLHISARDHGGRAGLARLIVAWGLLWPLSFFSKEAGALFPLFVLAWELIVRRSIVGGLDRFARCFAVVIGLILLAGTAHVFLPSGQWLWSGYDLRPFSLVERLMTEGRVLWFYLGLILFPRLEDLGLYHDDIIISSSLLSPWTTLPAIAGLIGLVWLAWRTRIKAPLLSFGIVWFLIGHGLESTFLPLEIAHEHRNYLPLFGILLAGAWALSIALQREGVCKTIGLTIAAAMLANFTFVTALRAHQFGEEGRRTQIEAQHHRTSARAQHEAAMNLAMQADAALPNSPIHSFATAHYQLACTLDPNSKMCWLGLIQLNCKAGIPAEPAWISELARRLQQTPFAPGDQNVLYAIKEMSIDGSTCLDRPTIDGLFSASLENPSVKGGVRSILYSWYSDYLWLNEHDMVAARAALGRSLKLNPGNPSNRLKWAQLLFIAGEREQARQLLLKLSNENLLSDERKTLTELLVTYNIAEH
ncbi:tetratricopeptide repeat protein [Candidatus Propionivibrio aalborgensis]|nr:pilus assembly protein PilF [Candidatus Propionivibrio aalborgensis]